jgi:hypothetical protein
MKGLSQTAFWLGIVSIPLSWLMWYFGAEIEVGRQVIGKIADPVLKAALMEAHGERWGIFVGIWPVTLLVLSEVLDRRSAGVKS